MEKYTSNFLVASDVSVRYDRRLPMTRLWLQDSLAIIVVGIQIIDGAANCLSIILGTNIFYLAKRFLHQRRLEESRH